LYLTFFWHPERLDLYLRFRDPAQVGTSAFDLGYFFSNGSSKSYLIENVSVYEVWLKSSEPVSLRHPSSKPAASDLSICMDRSHFPLSSLSLGMPSLVERAHQWNFPNGGKLAVLHPSQIYIDGIEAKSALTLVEPGKPKSIAATFTTEPLDRANYDIVVECPAVRFFSSTGRPLVAVCEGWQSTMTEESNGYFFQSPMRDSAELIPSPRSCTVEPEW
jgi:hypothetical protein